MPQFESAFEPDNEGSALKTLVFPHGKNTVLLRVANLDDRFDKPDWKPKVFNLTKYALRIYKEANMHLGDGPAEIDPSEIEITEALLTGAAGYAEAAQSVPGNRFEWNHEPEVTLKMQRMRRSGDKLKFPKDSELL